MRPFLFTLICLFTSFGMSQETIHILDVKNEIVLGPYAGNRNLAFGVQSILEEIVQDRDYYLSEDSETTLQVTLLYFDVKKTSIQIAVHGKNIDETQIIARGELFVNGKKKKSTVAKGTSKEISTATLIIDDGGGFSQAGVSTALKKVCDQIIKKLKL